MAMAGGEVAGVAMFQPGLDAERHQRQRGEQRGNGEGGDELVFIAPEEAEDDLFAAMQVAH